VDVVGAQVAGGIHFCQEVFPVVHVVDRSRVILLAV
jgi:hypothetical protein